MEIDTIKENQKEINRGVKGFTLIELIIVIVILGIIAGIAVPKFIGLAGNAKTSVARGVGGAISSTISVQHAVYLLDITDTYDLAEVLAATTFGGGVTSTMVVATSPTLITFTYKGTTFTWTYAVQNGDTPAYITETSGF